MCSCPARAGKYIFTTLSLEEGLSQTTARTMLRDSDGYLWIGTKSGLNRYDGGRMECFYSDPTDASTLPDNEIVSVFEDAEGRIWALCEKGVARFNREDSTFERVEYEGHPLRVRSHILRHDGVMLGGGGKIFFYNYTDKSVSHTPTSGGSNRYYSSIQEWSPDRYLLTTRWDGLWIYNAASGRIDRLGFCTDREIMASYVDDEGKLWVSPYGDGLQCYDRTGRCVHRSGAQTIGSDIVLDLLGSGNTVWVATDGGGLHTIDIRTFESSPVNNPLNDKLKGLRSVIRLYRDKFGYIYAGTVRDGMTCITETPLHTFGPQPGADGTTVTSLLANDLGIWIGVDGDGIILYEPEKNDRFTKFPATAGMKVTSLENYDGSHLLISTFDNGLYLFDRNTGAVSRAPAIFDGIVAANAKKALPLDLRRLSSDKMAVLTDRIYLADIRKNSWKEIMTTRVSNHLNEFYNDYRSMLCFTDGEIIRFDFADESVETLASVPERMITCAAYDGSRYIYFGTGADIKILDTESGNMMPMYNESPLPPRVTSLIYDNGKLWIGAGGGIYMKDLTDGRFCKFDRYDGVAPNEFIHKARLVTPTQLYLGGVNGMLKIDRNEIGSFLDRRVCAPVRVTDVNADGFVLASDDVDDAVYDVPYGHSNVTLRVDGGDTHPMRKSPFRFFINSPDGESPIETDDNTFTINRLSAGGRYDIFAQAVAPDGTWSAPRRVCVLNVGRPWWRSPWATFIYILLGLGAVAVVLAYIIRRRKRAAEKRIAQYQRESLEKEVNFLMEMNHELRTPLTLIYARLRGMIDSLQSSNIRDPYVLNELENIYQSTRKMRDIINTTVDQWVKPEKPETADEPVETETDTTPVTDDAPVDLSEMTVIIAEADPDLSEYIAENLKRMFGRVLIAPDGKDALAEVKNSNPDLIITDALLPGMSGTELCRRIKRLTEYSHIPIVMLTTRVEDMSLRGGHDLGADVYITKPFDMNQLANRCRMVMRSFDRVKQRYKSNASDILPRENYNNESESFLLKVKEIIEQNISNPGFSIDLIVEKMLISRSSLYSKFKELTGQSLGAYIEDYRISRAKEMLTTTDMTMSEISDALGFSTQRYFSTFFRKKTGIPPSQYRADS